VRLLPGKEDTTGRDRLLDRQITSLLWQVSHGMTAENIWLALRGEDSRYHAGRQKRVRLRKTVTTSRFFGVSPRASLSRVRESLDRLDREGAVILEEGLWRELGNVRREAARRARGAPR
jgi:hypothetical protein